MGLAGGLATNGFIGGGGTGGKGTDDVFAPVATGVAATDTSNLQAAITATNVGGTLWLDGHYKTNAVLTCAASIRLKGRDKVTYTGLSSLPSGPNALSQIGGTIIEQTVAATDGIDVTITGGTFHMEDVTVGFSNGLGSTGHGIKLDCGDTAKVGVYGSVLDGVMVFGHDGNHYALVLTNQLEMTTRDFRWSGGGGILTTCSSRTINSGNNVHIHPYGVLSATGSAHGFAHSSAANTGNFGVLNLITYVRPQCNIAGAAGATGTQKLWTDAVGASNPIYVSVISADLEASGFANPLDYGPSTEFIGPTYVASTATLNMLNSLNTRLGFQALALAGANATTQQKSVAIGQSTLAAQTTSVQNTAVGYFAGSAISTGTGLNTLVGYQAGKLITTGTTNTAIGGNALSANLTGGSCTAMGKDALLVNTASSNTAVGSQALNGVTSGSQHVAVGTGAGQTNPIAANFGTFVGYTAGTSGDFGGVTAIGNAAKGNAANATAIGKTVIAAGAGSVAIGIDHAGTAATTSTQDVIALGSPLHQVQISLNTTGAGSAALGANSPAVTNTAPYTWFKMMSSDGSTVYVPAWK